MEKQIENMIGKEVFIKFGNFHGQKAKVLKQDFIEGHERYLLQLQGGQVIYKKVKNTLYLGEVHYLDNDKEK